MKHFVLNEKHIKLLQNAYVDWNDCETGAPSIDCKRPYGNSDVLNDIVNILFGDLPDKTKKDLYDYAMQIHGETETALQIVLSTGKFDPGTYEKFDEYDNRSWRKI